MQTVPDSSLVMGGLNADTARLILGNGRSERRHILGSGRFMGKNSLFVAAHAHRRSQSESRFYLKRPHVELFQSRRAATASHGVQQTSVIIAFQAVLALVLALVLYLRRSACSLELDHLGGSSLIRTERPSLGESLWTKVRHGLPVSIKQAQSESKKKGS